MIQTVLIPADSTTAAIRCLQKEFIKKAAQKTNLLFIPRFPLWCILGDEDYQAAAGRKQITGCTILPIKITGQKLYFPVRLSVSGKKSGPDFQFIVAESQTIPAESVYTTLEALAADFSDREMPSRVFRIGTAKFTDTEWELLNAVWVKTAPKKKKYR
ncbi:MAG: hypothetical protein LKF96_10305 [Treponema sp.]|jgi:hypothetical protein|nr:hypothetical protein [Treponema sp.]